jgi:hypothetical protein
MKDRPELFNPSARRLGGKDAALEYTLGCGHAKVRKNDPPTPVGRTMFCWVHMAHAVVVSRDVVLIAPRRGR